MESKKRYASWWVEALTAIAWGLAALIRVRSMVHQGRADGWGVTLVLLFLMDTAVWTVRAVQAFRQQRFDKKVTEDNNIVDGGDIHD